VENSQDLNKTIQIIVPVYNVEKYISPCLDSIANQSYSNFQAILIDDGSTDNSGVICDEYCKKDKRFMVIHQKNKGLSEARNTGLDEAFKYDADYLTFMDSDDCYNRDYLKIMHEGITSNKADISVCNYLNFYDEDIPSSFDDKSDKWELLTGKDACKLLHVVLYIVVINKLYKRDIFSDIRFPKGKIYEDEWVTHKIIYKAKKICVTERKLYYYRKRKDSITYVNKDRFSFDAIDAIRDRIEYFKDKNEYELELLAANRLEQLCVEYHFMSLKNTMENIDYTKLKGIIRSLIKEYNYSPIKHPYIWICCLPNTLIRLLMIVKKYML